MKRREMLITSGAAIVGASMFPLGWTAAADKKKQKVLFFTRSAGFEHSAIQRKGGELGFAEKVLIELGPKHGFEVECTKDGAVFDGDLGKYDCIAFYTSGDLVKDQGKDPGQRMSAAGKKKLLEAVAAGKGFVGFHAATDSFRGPGIDPYIAMIGSEFVSHGPQQVAKVTVASPKFPGRPDATLALNEEWYALTKFAKDLHVILVQETEGMQGGMYQRPNFPATYARMHDKGRVFYTSFGHREDIWTNVQVQNVMLGGIAWALRNVDADVTPNLDRATPKANQMKN